MTFEWNIPAHCEINPTLIAEKINKKLERIIRRDGYVADDEIKEALEDELCNEIYWQGYAWEEVPKDIIEQMTKAVMNNIAHQTKMDFEELE